MFNFSALQHHQPPPEQVKVRTYISYLVSIDSSIDETFFQQNRQVINQSYNQNIYIPYCWKESVGMSLFPWSMIWQRVKALDKAETELVLQDKKGEQIKIHSRTVEIVRSILRLNIYDQKTQQLHVKRYSLQLDTKTNYPAAFSFLK